MKTSTPSAPRTVNVNPDQRLYVIPSQGGGYSCHGFDVVERLIGRLESEGLKVAGPLLRPVGEVDPQAAPGTPERYAYYRALCGEGSARNALTGWRSSAGLTPELIPFERRRVEVIHQWPDTHAPEKIRFLVGKSSGWMPVHLQLARRNVSGGPAVCLGKIISVRAV